MGPVSVSSRVSIRSDKFPDRLPSGEDGERAAREVAELGAGVDPQVAVYGGEQVLWRQGAFGWVFTPGVGGAHDLAHAEAPAGDKSGLRIGPMVAADQARGVRQPRGPAE